MDEAELNHILDTSTDPELRVLAYRVLNLKAVLASGAETGGGRAWLEERVTIVTNILIVTRVMKD